MTNIFKTKSNQGLIHKLKWMLLGTVLLSGCTPNDPSTWTLDSFGINNIQSPADLSKLINIVINGMAFVGGTIAIVIMIAGYQLLISAGSQEGQTKAKDTIKYAAMGLFLVLFAYAIVKMLFLILAPGAMSILQG